MIYEYKCFGCEKTFDVVKPVSKYKEEELCDSCGCIADRIPFPRKTYLHGTAVQEKTFNHALGIACTDKEAKQYAKAQGMIEVGNENVSKHADQTAAHNEERLNSEIDSVLKGI